MSLSNSSESHCQDETEILEEESLIPSENCSCDTDTVCDSCDLTAEIETDSKKNTMCRNKNKKAKQTVDSSTNQNCSTALHYSKGLANQKTTQLCLSEENISCKQSGEDGNKNKNIKTKFSCDYNALEESFDASSVETCENSNISKRIRRCSKRKRDIEDFCPVCGVTVRYSDLVSHFAKEVENLSKISKSIKKTRREENEGLNTTFVQVKTNRENRHAAKVAKFSTRTKPEVHCPICSLKLTGAQDEINNHVLSCITEMNDYDDEVIVVDDDVEDSFEEYEFADQTRVRAISMVPGGYRSLHGDSSKPRCTNDDDEELNVDVDDTLTYGNPQYTELDVIHNVTDGTEKEELEQLRKAVILDSTAERQVLESRKWGNNCDVHANSKDSCSSLDKRKVEKNIGDEAFKEKKCKHIEDQESFENEAADHIVSSLKEKIRDLEDQNKNVKCLICLEPYTKPVVSTTCWHVHCEECWLMTMGVKKLCPQCNMIVFPSDLRRIYL